MLYFFFPIILLFFFLYYKLYSIEKEIKKKKLVIRLPNHLGDTLMTYPMLLALEKSDIDFICIGKPWVKDLFSGKKFNIIATDNIKYCQLYKILIKIKSKYCLLCTNYLSTIIPCLFTGSYLIGNNYLCSSYIKYNNNLHQVENYWRLGEKFIDKKIDLKNIDEKIPFSNESILKANPILSIINNDFIVICPYANNLHKKQNKEWPHWKKFCQTFKKYKIILLVAKDDFIRAKKNYKDCLLFSENLVTTAYIMTKAKYVLTNDSGAMHLASFFGANVIGIFGPTDIVKTRPWYGKYLIGKDNDFIKCNELINYIK